MFKTKRLQPQFQGWTDVSIMALSAYSVSASAGSHRLLMLSAAGRASPSVLRQLYFYQPGDNKE